MCVCVCVYLLCVCLCLYVCSYEFISCVCQCPWRPEEGIRFHGHWVTSTSEKLNIGAVDQTQVLCKSTKCIPGTHLGISAAFSHWLGAAWNKCVGGFREQSGAHVPAHCLCAETQRMLLVEATLPLLF